MKTLWKDLNDGNSNQQYLEIDFSFRDEIFIKNKIKQLKNDVISIQKVFNRIYSVQYLNWKTGLSESGSIEFDYSNSSFD